MRKLLRELRQAFPGSKITVTGHSHYRVQLPGNTAIFVSNTPKSRQGCLRAAIADARRRSITCHRSSKTGERCP